MTTRRQFHRHPMCIPLTVQTISRAGEQAAIEAVYTKNVSLGGLAFTSEKAWKEGTLLHIHIKAESPFTFMGKVMWCRPLRNKNLHENTSILYDIGVEFMAKKAEMLDELVRIENYYKLR
jgi:Tfp pilus assembly protein PilZ